MEKEKKEALKSEMQNFEKEVNKELEFLNNRLNALNTHNFDCYINNDISNEINLNELNTLTADELEMRINELLTKKIIVIFKDLRIRNKDGVDAINFLINALRVRFVKTRVSKTLELLFYYLFFTYGFVLASEEYSDIDIIQEEKKFDVKAVKLQQSFGFDVEAIINNDFEAKIKLLAKLSQETQNKKDDEDKIYFITISKSDNEENRTKNYVNFHNYFAFLWNIKKNGTLEDYYFETKNKYNEPIKGYAFFFIID